MLKILKQTIHGKSFKSNINQINHKFFIYSFTLKFFHLHEYEAKVLLRKHGLNVEKCFLVKSTNEALYYASRLNNKVMIKCQVHAGGRSKGRLTSGLQGGVHVCRSEDDIKNICDQMLGHNLITNQTTKEGLPVKSLLISEIIDVKKLYYLAIILDRQSQGPIILASNEGGVDIEEIACKNPDAIIRERINVLEGLSDGKIKKIVERLSFTENERIQAIDQLKRLYRFFFKYDITQIEINPWAVDESGKLYILDAKVNVDDSASYRQTELLLLKESTQVSEDIDPNEIRANEVGISYVGLQGNIGCMVNGAGLAMATMDIIKLKGGDPANFLDVGGGADEFQVTQAFLILSNQSHLKAILINIFGGIMKCDIIAKGIIKAAQKIEIKIPIVIRLTGTNQEEGNKLIEDFANKHYEYKFITADDLDEAAEKAVNFAK